jgi:hypothetical protein
MVVNFIALIIITFLGGIIYFGLERKNVRVARRACATRAAAADAAALLRRR